MSDAPIRTFPRQRHIWHCLCAHLATAWRLRTRLGTTRSAIDAAIVGDTGGDDISDDSNPKDDTRIERIKLAPATLRLKAA